MRCLPTEIPQGIELDISSLGIGDSATVADIVIPEEIEVLTPDTEVVVSILAPRLEEEVEDLEAEETEAEQTAEPETESEGE